jgi:histidinol phosphatase-like enzyme
MKVIFLDVDGVLNVAKVSYLNVFAIIFWVAIN